MNISKKTFEPAPLPEPDSPTPEPATERPRRREFVQPTFRRLVRIARIASAAVIIGCALNVNAQSGNPTTTTPHTQQPGTTVQDHGWVMFNDSIARSLNIPADQMKRLTDVDARYRAEYTALGTSPTSNKDYHALTDRRNAEIRGIMGQEGYDRWARMYDHSRVPATDKPGTGLPPPTSPTPAPAPKR